MQTETPSQESSKIARNMVRFSRSKSIILQGQFKVVYKNGTIYEGTYKDDKRHSGFLTENGVRKTVFN